MGGHVGSRSRSLVLVASCLAVGIIATSGEAADTTGELHGIVADGEGSGLTGVRISLSSEVLIGGVHQRITGDGGKFGFRLLPPGSYLVRAELEDFVPVETQAVVSLNRRTDLRIEMSTARFSDEITVEVAAATGADGFHPDPRGRGLQPRVPRGRRHRDRRSIGARNHRQGGRGRGRPAPANHGQHLLRERLSHRRPQHHRPRPRDGIPGDQLRRPAGDRGPHRRIRGRVRTGPRRGHQRGHKVGRQQGFRDRRSSVPGSEPRRRRRLLRSGSGPDLAVRRIGDHRRTHPAATACGTSRAFSAAPELPRGTSPRSPKNDSSPMGSPS